VLLVSRWVPPAGDRGGEGVPAGVAPLGAVARPLAAVRAEPVGGVRRLLRRARVPRRQAAAAPTGVAPSGATAAAGPTTWTSTSATRSSASPTEPPSWWLPISLVTYSLGCSSIFFVVSFSLALLLLRDCTRDS
jgi:hypothetical protein